MKKQPQNQGQKAPQKHQISLKNNIVEGIISISAKGTGYVAVPELGIGQDPEIDFKHLKTALHGDTVKVVLHPKGKSRQTGEVVEIIKRAKMRFAGVLEKENSLFFLKPDDHKMYTDILIPTETLGEAKEGQKVFVEITSWKDPRKAPEGKILKVLGAPGDNDVEMHSIAIEKGFSADFPPLVEREAEAIEKKGIQAEDLVGRKDFRTTLTFTIDPADAKDFDDAISFKELTDGNFEVGIHIADVSHYVRPGTELDKEARERGTSVYLVDRTIPMLPEALSNDLCSLVPDKDRLTMGAVFVLNKNAEVVSEWFGKTVIHSQKRFTYEEAEVSIHKAGTTLHKELSTLNTLAKKLNKDRIDSGALIIEQDEIKFVLDAKGVPTKVMKKERGDSNKLIEEFMLLANRNVAHIFTKHKKGKESEMTMVYRVHEPPSVEKMADLAFFLKSLGYKVSLKDGLIPTKELNTILLSLSEKEHESLMKDTISKSVIRSMAKAVYSTKNIGHYGLAFKYYTVFTSPIRRYPDIIVHRLLMEHLNGTKDTNTKETSVKIYENMSRIASEQEKRAADAERQSIKYKQVEYMSTRIGKTFDGIISGITEFGMYVEEIETKCEGMIRVRDLGDDFYIFNEKKLELLGQKKKKKYVFGGKVKIKVKGVDLERKTIDYILA